MYKIPIAKQHMDIIHEQGKHTNTYGNEGGRSKRDREKETERNKETKRQRMDEVKEREQVQ